MSKQIISEGKTTNEAIENGLKILNLPKSAVDIKVLEEEKKSFFSILTPRVVKVELTVKDNARKDSENKKVVEEKKYNHNQNDINKAVETLDKFIKDFISKQPVQNIEYKIEVINYDIEIKITGNDVSYLIGHRGETLNCIQTVVSSIINKNYENKINVHVDINGYRQKRIKTLEDLASKVSKTVLSTRKPVVLEPMSAYERKIIHSKLQQNDKIKTYSKGEEPYRRIVIDLNK